MKKITKAVIPAAGLGTRMLPIARAVPKEMLNIVDKPAIAYLVEEAVNSGITDILIVTGRGKSMMEDYFDYSPEYESKLTSSGKTDTLKFIRGAAEMANIYFIRQLEPKGLGHAVLRSKEFIGNDPFAVLYGDDVILSKTPAVKQLVDAYNKYDRPTALVRKVSHELITKYCSLDTQFIADNCYWVNDMIEKPSVEQIMSDFSILGRVLLTPDIFDVLEHTKPGKNGEIQLTDAMAAVARRDKMVAVDFEGERYDIGNKLGLLKANIDVALNHPEIKDEFADYLKHILKNI